MANSEELLTFANILGKVASAALIVPTSEALGQLKWNWFYSSKAMWDFEIFDKASRGPGQVVVFPDQWALQATRGEIPRVVFYDPVHIQEYRQGFERTHNNRHLRPVIQEFFYGNGTQPVAFGNGTRPEIPLSCPTSNCTWPPYETLAVCSQCTEISTLINVTLACLNTTVDWSTHWEGPLRDVPYPTGTVCGHFLNATSENPILLSGYSVNETNATNLKGEALLVRFVPLTGPSLKERFFNVGSVAFKDNRNPIFDNLIVSAVNGVESVYRQEPPVIHECVLLWCVQTIQSSYDWGRYNEEVVSTFYNTSTGPSPWDSWPYPEDEGGGFEIVYKENVTIERVERRNDYSNSTISSQRYGVNNVTVSGAINIFDDLFPAYYAADTVSSVPRLRFQNFDDGPSLRTLHYFPWQAPHNLTQHMERLALAMTNVIRSSVSKEMVSGEAYSREKFVSIKWEWLIFPLLLLLLSFIFLISTIIKTSKNAATGVWKTSAMPTLIYSLPKETQSHLAAPSTWNSEKGTKKVRIKLLPERGWRVSGSRDSGMSTNIPPTAKRAPCGWI
ncbi:hypothetical protein BKA66DRAFT_599733 [Pyrenochaeta sp. MPI-SDFR-AT-0127]|nr:hypothetical protein BKA66DRAFT_599733 [Pyrenochaeta sp. MPI-SDFR-AT-0127]